MTSKIIYGFTFLLKAKSSKQILLNHPELNKILGPFDDTCEVLKKLELHRKSYLQNHHTIPNINLGAGKNQKNEIKISSIASKSVSSVKDRKLLYHLVKNLEPKTVIELGTSLGFATASMALANDRTNIISIEGNPNIAQLANQIIQNFNLNNVEITVGNFDQVLPVIQHKIQTPFLAFIDGNHSYEATLRYFNWFTKIASEKCLLVFHDIHWSEGMYDAWQEICQKPLNITCIEDFRTGIVFFSKTRKSQRIITWSL